MVTQQDDILELFLTHHGNTGRSMAYWNNFFYQSLSKGTGIQELFLINHNSSYPDMQLITYVTHYCSFTRTAQLCNNIRWQKQDSIENTPPLFLLLQEHRDILRTQTGAMIYNSLQETCSEVVCLFTHAK